MVGALIETHSLAWDFNPRDLPMSRTTSFHRYLVECGHGSDVQNVIGESTGVVRRECLNGSHFNVFDTHKI